MAGDYGLGVGCEGGVRMYLFGNIVQHWHRWWFLNIMWKIKIEEKTKERWLIEYIERNGGWEKWCEDVKKDSQ